MKVACIWFEDEAPTERLADLFLRFSPQICLRKKRAIFVEIGKCEKLYSEQSFIMRSQVLLKKQKARIVVGHDITDSLALAKFNQTKIEGLPLEALLEFADPFERDEVLRKGVSNLIQSFHDLGVKNLGQFKKIPIAELISRYGIVARHCHNRVHMRDLISWPRWTPEEIIYEIKEFPYFEFYGELDPILFELKSQLDHIFSRLFARRKRLTQLQVQIRCEKLSVNPNFLRSFKFSFYTPQNQTKITLRIIKERLAKDFEKNPVFSPIEAIETRVLKSVSFLGVQKNILSDDEEKFEQIYSIHEQLVEILGKENVFEAELSEDPRPEKSWKKKFGQLHESAENEIDLSEIIPERATYLCQTPVKIEVTAGYVHIRKRKYKILHWDNEVEKISGGWFEKPVAEIKDSFDRNYYHVEIEGQQRITIFETPSREFFLHGYYG